MLLALYLMGAAMAEATNAIAQEPFLNNVNGSACTGHAGGVQRGADRRVFGPPMSECLCVANDSIYVLFESGSARYSNAANRMDRVFRRTGY